MVVETIDYSLNLRERSDACRRWQHIIANDVIEPTPQGKHLKTQLNITILSSLTA